MFFNLFGKKKEPAHSFTDLVYISQQAKQNGVISFANQNDDFIFIAWFEDTAEKFRQLFAQNGMSETRIEEAKYFTPAKYTSKQIAFLEHYPLRAREEKLVQNSSQQKFTVYNSLTEPLFLHFGGQRIIDLMPRMGYVENESLQHSMISKSLQRAQKKIAEKMNLEQPASSQEEWMRKNIPTNK